MGPDTFQTSSRHPPDTFQTPSRHPLETLQTPSRHPPASSTFKFGKKQNLDTLTGCWLAGWVVGNCDYIAKLQLGLSLAKWGRISPQSDWCWFKLVLGSSSLLLRGSKDLSLTVGHESECLYSGTHY